MFDGNTFSRRNLVSVARRYGDHDVSGLAAELSFRILLALFPFFVFLAALGASIASAADVENPAQEIVDSISDTLPDDAASLLERELQSLIQAPGGLPLALGLLGALWTGTLATEVAVKGLNRIHGIDDTRPTWKRYLMSLGLTIVVGVLVVVAIAAWVAAQAFGPQVAGEIGLAEGLHRLVGLAFWPISFVAVVAAATLLYWLGPAKKRDYRWVSAGGLGFAAVWLVGSVGFAIYINNFNNLNTTYGTLSGVIIALIWIYLTSSAFLLGAEFDDILVENVGNGRG